ncbi:beta-1,3-galactosyltransferase 5-like [Drosophila novamexicana]|uniref:beta-1,3-galactosyltransferase 5-like n=1 Tax=Drosophila novamexicana TaxID=47314 RepID=UPI0011E589FD|nr:beta-1,3-galactosyltransferase 5-like [Drosophila novamexicana]
MKRKIKQLLATGSNISLYLWIIICLLIYLFMPDGPRIVPQQLTTVEPVAAYSENSQQLIDLQDFDYVIKQTRCKPHIRTLIVVHSAPHNIEKRSVIRRTWGSPSVISTGSPLRLFFLVGAVEDEAMQAMLLAEHTRHGDLLQGNFLDGYFNLTYKHVMALKWFYTRCEPAQLLVKVDDDIYLNTPQLLQHLRLPFSTDSVLENLLLCAIRDRDRVVRSYSSKWRVSFWEYYGRYYPPFCPGFAVFYSSDVVRRLYVAAQRSSFFRLDDVFVTGLLSKRSNITITDLTPYVLGPDELNLLLSRGTESEQLNFLVSWHNMSEQQINGLWQLYGTTY